VITPGSWIVVDAVPLGTTDLNQFATGLVGLRTP
jgi:hypothetical protein